jgi:membrane associated rhomboid family serine protease
MSFEDLHRPLSRAGFRGAIAWIIGISGVMLVAQQFAGQWLVPYLGLIPSQVIDHYWLWQPFTYLFLHGGIFHWLFNMLILWMFGAELERRWGTVEFLKYFFLTGVGAAVCVLLMSPHSPSPTIGASGAVFGLIVAFAFLFPHSVMYLYFLIPMKVWQAAILFAVIELFAGLEGAGGSGISRFAHLGGMLTGYLYLKFSAGIVIQVKGWFRSIKSAPVLKRKPVELHEVTDELVSRVDKILDKVLSQGVESLTPEEKRIMDRYAKTKH